MFLFPSVVISCLLVTSTLKWRPATSLPVQAQLSSEECKKCSALFVSLLRNITGLLSGNVLCYGLKPNDKATVSSSAETVQACAPNVQEVTRFCLSECVSSIMKDMVHYDALIQSYLKLTLRSPEEETALLSPTLEIIHNLKEDTSYMWGDNSFTNRREMCKMMRGFHIRAITINRAMGYLSSGDHLK
uniref:Interleukin 12a n=1 Tax=Hippocampus comes TaxID=109280 RepID=A0A3Q3DRZ7_HIPCM